MSTEPVNILLHKVLSMPSFERYFEISTFFIILMISNAIQNHFLPYFTSYLGHCVSTILLYVMKDPPFDTQEFVREEQDGGRIALLDTTTSITQPEPSNTTLHHEYTSIQ